MSHHLYSTPRRYMIGYFFERNRVILILGSLCILSVIVFGWYGVEKFSNRTTHPLYRQISHTIKAQGITRPRTQSLISFGRDGYVDRIAVALGATVSTGQTLAMLSDNGTQALLDKAEENVSYEEKKLEEILPSSRTEEFASTTEAKNVAQEKREEAYSLVPQQLQDIDTTVSNVIENELSPLYVYHNDTFSLSFVSCNQAESRRHEEERNALETNLAAFQKQISGVSTLSSPESLDLSLNQAGTILKDSQVLITSLSKLISQNCAIRIPLLQEKERFLAEASRELTETAHQYDVFTQTLFKDNTAYLKTSATLAFLQDSSAVPQIEAQQDRVTQAKSEATERQREVQKGILSAPFDGTIDAVSLSEKKPANHILPAVTMHAQSTYEIDISLSPLEYAQVKPGDTAIVTFHGKGNRIMFDGVVASSTTIKSPYTVTVSFKHEDKRIENDTVMDVEIIIENKENVLSVPLDYVTFEKDGTTRVKVVEGNTSTARNITLGIIGNDGYAEVTSGLEKTGIVLLK